MKFEKVLRYPDAILPIRSTEFAGGYDLFAAEDITIPSYQQIIYDMTQHYGNDYVEQYFSNQKNILPEILKKYPNWRPTLVPTGIKIYLDKDKTFEISARSSLPRKNWLVVANAPGIIDADYVDNIENEGQIYVQLINFAPFEFTIYKGEKFAQGVIRQYFTVDDDVPGDMRQGGFGSTGS